MRTIVQQAAVRIHECNGQEVLDVVEAISTGGYIDAVDKVYWDTLMDWTGEKYERARRYLDENAGLPLALPRLSDFDRALAVQDYREQLSKFDLIGLGFTYTARLLEHIGVRLPEGSVLEEWTETARQVAVNVRHEGDMEKNAEAQEGLKVCRTVCVYRYSLRRADGDGAAELGPTAITSGPADEAHELGLFATTLRHHRGGDGEFKAMQACARACADLGRAPAVGGGGLADIDGELWVHVSEVPCLSCVSAMAQFRRLFPDITLHCAFTLGRQPAAVNGCNGVGQQQSVQSTGRAATAPAKAQDARAKPPVLSFEDALRAQDRGGGEIIGSTTTPSRAGAVVVKDNPYRAAASAVTADSVKPMLSPSASTADSVRGPTLVTGLMASSSAPAATRPLISWEEAVRAGAEAAAAGPSTTFSFAPNVAGSSGAAACGEHDLLMASASEPDCKRRTCGAVENGHRAAFSPSPHTPWTRSTAASPSASTNSLWASPASAALVPLKAAHVEGPCTTSLTPRIAATTRAGKSALRACHEDHPDIVDDMRQSHVPEDAVQPRAAQRQSFY